MRLAGATLAVGHVVAIEVDGDEFVAWRGGDGRVRAAPRWCPHLDHDLNEGYVVGDELVCVGHAWAFDGDGHTYKRNEFGSLRIVWAQCARTYACSACAPMATCVASSCATKAPTV